MDDIYGPVVDDVKSQLENMGFSMPYEPRESVIDFQGFIRSVSQIAKPCVVTRRAFVTLLLIILFKCLPLFAV